MPQRRAPLSAAHYDEAVFLLAELLLDVAAKRREGRSVGVIDSACGSGMGSVVTVGKTRLNGRDAA